MTDFFHSLAGKTALVTGSTRGIGRALALGLARCGVHVAMHGVKPNRTSEEGFRELRETGAPCACVFGDLSVRGQAAEVYRQAVSRLGSVDILILNASIQVRAPLRQITPEEFDRQLQVNLQSSLALMQCAVPSMREKGWGRIVTIGSVQQVKPHPDMMVYSASKSALVNLTASLAKQLAPYGITVNNVAPGTILTDRNRDALADPEYCRQVKEQIPVRFFGDADECTPLVLTLCSDYGRFITGDDIFVDGGAHIP